MYGTGLGLYLDVEGEGGAQDDLARSVPNGDDHRSLRAIARHHIASHISKAALSLGRTSSIPSRSCPSSS